MVNRKQLLVLGAALGSLGLASPAIAGDVCEVNGTDALAGAAAGAGALACGVGSTASGLNSTATGNTATASNTAATADGYLANASGIASTALGHNTIANSLGSTAVGVSAHAQATGATAMGRLSTASGVNSTALGANATATADNSVALGNGSVADQANTISVGAVGSERRIVNVAAGTAATDAVNLGQLNAAAASLATEIDTLFDLRSRDRKEARRGTAAAVAMSEAPMPSRDGAVSYSVHGSVYRGEYAAGASLKYRINRSAAVDVGLSYAGHGDTAARVGISGEF